MIHREGEPYAAGLALVDSWIRQFYLPYMLSLPDWFPISDIEPVNQHAERVFLQTACLFVVSMQR